MKQAAASALLYMYGATSFCSAIQSGSCMIDGSQRQALAAMANVLPASMQAKSAECRLCWRAEIKGVGSDVVQQCLTTMANMLKKVPMISWARQAEHQAVQACLCSASGAWLAGRRSMLMPHEGHVMILWSARMAA